jgi:hypothetical protein
LDLGVDFSHLIDKGIVKYQAEEEQEDIDEENTSLDLELTAIGQCHFCGENLKDKRKGSLFCNSKHRASYHNNQKKASASCYQFKPGNNHFSSQILFGSKN